MNAIVKIQVPPSGRLDLALVHAEDDAHVIEQAIPPEVGAALKGDSKGFFEAEWTGKLWTIGKRVSAQSW
jgi:hypothetical protein